MLYFSFIPFFEGKPVDEIKQKLRMDLGPTYFPMWKTAAQYEARDFSRFALQHTPLAQGGLQPRPASASLGQLTDVCWLAGHTGLGFHSAFSTLTL